MKISVANSLIKTKRPNCTPVGGFLLWTEHLSPLFDQSQAEAHYKGNRHARRVKGIETCKTGRHQDGDKPNPPLIASSTPPCPEPSSPESDPNRQGLHHLWYVITPYNSIGCLSIQWTPHTSERSILDFFCLFLLFIFFIIFLQYFFLFFK